MCAAELEMRLLLQEDCWAFSCYSSYFTTSNSDGSCPFKLCSKSVVFADSLPFIQGTFCNITLSAAPDQHCTLRPWAHIYPLLLQLLRETLHLVHACTLEMQWNLSIAKPFYRWHTDIGACRAVWVPEQDLATPHLMCNCGCVLHYTVRCIRLSLRA